MGIPSDKLEQYDRLISHHPNIERKGKTNPYTSYNGHMFSFLDQTGSMGLRLSKADKSDFEAKFSSPPYVQHGRIMKEYVTIPASLLADTTSLIPYLEASLAYIRSLKPKTTKRKT